MFRRGVRSCATDVQVSALCVDEGARESASGRQSLTIVAAVDGSGDGNASTAAKIPVFASVPSWLNDDQKRSKAFIYELLDRLYVEPRTVGASDEAQFDPLKEVRTLARHCAGGIILGYTQFFAENVSWRGDNIDKFFAPTEWNHLETGVLFGLGLPLLVLSEPGVDRGIFGVGSSGMFVHEMPMPPESYHAERTSESTTKRPKASDPGVVAFQASAERFERVLLRWQSRVQVHYYGDDPTT